ncbi:MAG: hypothetical protein MZW92_47940 [Comamonadaceae bacterium]|nr:hypothetical protein [Comamonadaceae bacterium]
MPHLPLAAALAVSGAILAMLCGCVMRAYPPGGRRLALYAVLGGEAVHALGYRLRPDAGAGQRRAAGRGGAGGEQPAAPPPLIRGAHALTAATVGAGRPRLRRPDAPAIATWRRHSRSTIACSASARRISTQPSACSRGACSSASDGSLRVAGRDARRRAERARRRPDADCVAQPAPLRRLPAIAVVDGDNRLVGLVGMNDRIPRPLRRPRRGETSRRRIARYLLHGYGPRQHGRGADAPPAGDGTGRHAHRRTDALVRPPRLATASRWWIAPTSTPAWCRRRR